MTTEVPSIDMALPGFDNRPVSSRLQNQEFVASITETPSRESLPLPVTALILCGGKSKRMGRTKAFLPFEGRTIIEHQIDIVRSIFDEVFLVTNEPEQYSHLCVDVVKDILPYRGPLGGILSGLLVSTNPYSLVIACDMPLINKKLLRQMASERHGHDVVVLSHDREIEPLLGLYSKSCIKPLEESLFSGNLKVQDFLCGLKAKPFNYLDYDSTSSLSTNELPPFFNVDTPQDYTEILKITRKEPRPQNYRNI